MRIGILYASLATLLVAAGPAFAQGVGFPGQGPAFNAIGGKGPAAGPKVAPPPALPGAKSTGTAAPSDRPALDMEPNEALFDAINRGDIGAARDAISRGADLGARNILGMTPMELSVDLGRNDISFLLLSMRNGDKDRNRPAPPAETAAKSSPGRQAKQVPRTPALAQVKESAPAPSQTPRLFSGDGGTPNPNAGFLGFDSGRR
jgi:hypothetical protein